MKHIYPLLSIFIFSVFINCTELNAQRITGYNTAKNAPNFYKLKKLVAKKLEKEEEQKEKALRKLNKKNGIASVKQVGVEEDDENAKLNRWEWFWESRVSKTGAFPSPSVNWDEWKAYKANHSSKNSNRVSAVGSWSFIGPNSTVGGYEGIGRVNCVGFHPTDKNTFWIGSPAGGLWKTVDGGLNWNSSFDNQPVLGVSDIAIDPATPSTMYIATGDGDGGSLRGLTGTSSGDTKSVGILKSTDNGSTWNTTGLGYTFDQGVLIRRLVIDPTNPQVLFAATSNGIYKTANGGTSWTMIQTGYFIDIELKPGNSQIIYAATYGSNAQVYRSSDGGISWNVVSNFTSLYRIDIAVTPANASIVDIICSKSDRTFGGVFRSTDSGQTFNVSYDASVGPINLLDYKYDGSGTGGQGEYDLCYAISPVNANKVFMGGVNTWTSNDGGNNWTINTMWTGDSFNNPTSIQTVHADKHWLAYSPVDPNILIQCNDGGVYKSIDAGTTWQDISNGLQISEVYRIGSSATNGNVILAGLQDNGTKSFMGGNNWQAASGGDGMECAVDPTNDNTMYSTYVQGTLYRSYDGFTSNTTTISDNISGGKPTGAWVTPYVLDPNDPNTIIAGYNDVYRSNDQGNSWTQLSFSLAGGSTLRSLTVAPSNSQVIYTATFSNIYKTTDDGISWTTLSGLPAGAVITYIAVHPANPQIVWVTLSGYYSGQKVYKSIDGGSTWTNISGTLPNIPANCIAYDKSGNNADRLFIGTDLGVFYKDNNMSDWAVYGTSLPNVVVTELEIFYAGSKIRAATFGRGVWEADLPSAAPSADLAVTKTVSAGSYPIGQNVTYTITATNNGSLDATGVIVNDILPGTLTYVSSSATVGVYNAITGMWTIGNLTNGANATLTIVAQVTTAGTIKNCATISGNEADNVSANNSSCVSIVADLPPTANFTIDKVQECAGENITFTNTSTGTITTYNWDFGVGATPATALTVGPHVVTYSSGGVKNIQLTVGNTGGQNSKTNTVTINALPATPMISYNANTLLLTCQTSAVCYQWYLGGVLIPGATLQTLQLTVQSKSGNYSCKICDVNGCTTTSNTTMVSIVSGINEILSSIGIEVYPNPASTQISITQKQIGSIKRVVLSNAIGQIVADVVPSGQIQILDVSSFE
jgi:uncharacterized repeat protein (TIGR01451 family)